MDTASQKLVIKNLYLFMYNTALHQFHIPVMGLAYTIDSPVKVARFGISSVLSIIEDNLIESMRSYYYPKYNKVYIPITDKEEDYRAKRITDYLNLLHDIVQQQVAEMKAEPFEASNEIVQYFEMLPDDSAVKKMYNNMLQLDEGKEKEELKKKLRQQIQPGSIDVNIMTKVDNNNYTKDGDVIEDGSDAVAALRGYVNSNLPHSSIVFSAGLNPRLYNYLEKCTEFDADENGLFQKKVIVKVSDYRSALVQGKYLAKKGIWVSEFRIESGLNCGGHAFATDGFLLASILEEFRLKKEELQNAIFELYNAALKKKGNRIFKYAPQLKISVQGGIGTSEEAQMIINRFRVDSIGWGTPFLLVPQATSVDEATLQLLCKTKEDDVVLSGASPLGVRFYNVKNTSAGAEKLKRIERNKPGSPCTEKLLQFNTEFTEKPICTASSEYQKKKLQQLKEQNLPAEEYNKQESMVLEKECLCVGLSNAAPQLYNVPFVKNLHAVTICPGPNIAYFSKSVSLQSMVDHIYGRENIIERSDRPHVFINELNIYIQYLAELLEENKHLLTDEKKKKYYTDFYRQLTNGIAFYKLLIAEQHFEKAFETHLYQSENMLNELARRYNVAGELYVV